VHPWCLYAWPVTDQQSASPRLSRDAESGEYTSPLGVEVRPAAGFDAAVMPSPGLTVYECIVEALQLLGWEVGASMWAHNYDWR
jgi:Lecithin:cholesterol acyltransferase